MLGLLKHFLLVTLMSLDAGYGPMIQVSGISSLYGSTASVSEFSCSLGSKAHDIPATYGAERKVASAREAPYGEDVPDAQPQN